VTLFLFEALKLLQ